MQLIDRLAISLLASSKTDSDARLIIRKPGRATNAMRCMGLSTVCPKTPAI